MNKSEEPDIDLDEEYGRIAENKGIYLGEVTRWKKLETISLILMLISGSLVIMCALLLPTGTPLPELFPDYPLQVSLFCVSSGLFLGSMIAYILLSDKTSKIQEELGLHREERLYLLAYEVHTNIDSYLNESSPKRKLYFKKSALAKAQELTETVEGWRYGNIRLVSNLIGDQIDLLKDNMKRLVLSNVAKGEDTALEKISKILVELCDYIRSPSITKIDELNEAIKEIPFKEYKYLTRKERMSRFLYGKPRASSLVCAFGTTITVVAVLLCLEQNLAFIIGVGVACFWSAFAGFDRIFRVKET